MDIVLSSNLQYDSIIDGEGVRTVIWTQGCPHRCKGCHNPGTHAFDKGTVINVNEIKKELLTIKRQDGITLSGGEPFAQAKACAELASFAKQNNLNVWCYTGYTFEEIIKLATRDNNYMELLKNIDVLVDGRFIMEQKSYNLRFRGSANQRVIDVRMSLEKNKICVIEKYNENLVDFPLYFKEEGVYV
jgi:anaerobic ribonucleoside-triphosphate reductase activating protein